MKAGDIIGLYQLLRQLGAGAFGEVWVVRHLDLGVQRAMKIPTDLAGAAACRTPRLV